MLVLYRLLPINEYLVRTLGNVGKWISILITFHIVCFGWILFRAQTTTIVPLLQSIGQIFEPGDFSVTRIYTRGLVFLGSIVLITDYLGYRQNVEFPELFRRMNPYFAATVAVGCYFGLTVLAKREAAQFIYFQF
jgi:hypothetical protein